MRALLDSLLWLDRVVNALLGGSFYETLSARAYRMDEKNHPWWGWTASAINALFFWQPDHCRIQWQRELAHTFPRTPMFPRDKVQHFCVSLLLMLVLGQLMAMGYAVALTLLVGAAKEVYDARHPDKHTADWLDMLAGMAGVGVGLAIFTYLPTWSLPL
jgi:hypothetical protein